MSSNSPPRKEDGEEAIDRVPVVPPTTTEGETLSSNVRDWDVDSVRRYLATKLGFYEPPEPPAPVEKVLDEVTLDGIVKWIQSDRCKKIITLAGAGISTSAGIPDFRSPETGLYHNLQKYNLPEPQAIFEINFFRQNPKPFFMLAKELYPGNFKPTISHYFIRLLNEKGLLLRHYTQNIDTLERCASIPDDKIVEAHGTFYTSHCLECRKQYDLDYVKERIFADQIPICTECPGVVKPDIVFFGESLPKRFEQCLQEDFQHCDMLIVMGSSLEVQPFASLIDMVPDWCPRLLINREKAGVRSPIMRMLGLGGGLQFDGVRDVAQLGDCDVGCQLLADKLGWGIEDIRTSPSICLLGLGGGLQFDGVRDVAQLGDCDVGCQLLADKLGWGDELRALMVQEHSRLEREGNIGSPPIHPLQAIHPIHPAPEVAGHSGTSQDKL